MVGLTVVYAPWQEDSISLRQHVPLLPGELPPGQCYFLPQQHLRFTWHFDE